MGRRQGADSIGMILNKWRLCLITLCLATLFSVVGQASATPSATERFKLGGLFSLTGFGQKAGESHLYGTQLAVDEINAKGGVAGRSIELIVEDFRSDLKTTASAMQKLTSIDKVAAVIGPNWTEFSEVAAGVATKNQILMITPSGYTKTLTKDRPFVFSALENHGAITAPLSSYIARQRPKKLAALVMQNSFHQSIFEAISAQLTSTGVSVWRTFEITPGNQDFRSILTRLKAEDVDAVLILLLEDGTGFSFLKQARELAFKGRIYSGNSILYDEAFKADPGVADEVVLFDYKIQHSPQFEQRFRERFKTEPMADSGRAYDLVFAVKKAAETCGTQSEAIRDCLSKQRLEGVSGLIGFDNDRNLIITRPVSTIYRMQGGAPIPLDSLPQ